MGNLTSTRNVTFALGVIVGVVAYSLYQKKRPGA